jgi:pyruvate formate lyase activating enzyme
MALGGASGLTAAPAGTVFLVSRFAIHDGPGLRLAVFLKGCPLRCLWCHSPESQARRPELLFKSDRCVRCGTCLASCRSHAIADTGAGFATDHVRCDGCGDCVDCCPTGARSLAGRTLTVPALMKTVEAERVFFGASGGVTFSGGEPLMQPRFLSAAIDACRAAGVHVAVETSGYAAPTAADVLLGADLVLFDLKLADDARHRRATGVSNRPIRDNFRRLTRHHARVAVRVPVIPGINDDPGNLEAIARFAVRHGVPDLTLLPYHTAGRAKYARLDRPYTLEATPALPAAALLETAARLERIGLSVHIGG